MSEEAQETVDTPEEQGAPAEAGTEEASAPDGAGADPTMPLVVIDPSEEDRLHVSGLADDLGRAVSTLDPGAFAPALLADLRDAAAIVIEWDLGGRLGIDFMETLRRASETAQVPVILASAALTAARVRAARALGAQAFVTKPYDAEELKARVAALPVRPS